MARLTRPDYVFGKFSDITPSFLKDLGIKALLVDIDNTLAPYEEATPNERVVAWIDTLSKNGISVALISNNNQERVELFNRELSLVAFSKSGKPFPKNLRAAMKLLGSDESNTAMLGDQLLTDAAAGKNIGLKTIVVPPINDRSSAFFRFKRALEVPSMKKFARSHPEQADACAFWTRGGYKKKNRK